MFDLGHLSDQIGGHDQLGRSIASGDDDVQSGLGRANRTKLLENLIHRQHAVTQHVNELIEYQQVVITRPQLFNAQRPRLTSGFDVLLGVLCVPRKKSASMRI